jgi:hypothetical protein
MLETCNQVLPLVYQKIGHVSHCLIRYTSGEPRTLCEAIEHTSTSVYKKKSEGIPYSKSSATSLATTENSCHHFPLFKVYLKRVITWCQQVKISMLQLCVEFWSQNITL